MLKIFAAYSRLVLNHPKLLLLLALLLSAVFAFLGKNVRLDNQFASLFTVDNAASRFQQSFRQQFGADDALLIALIQPKTVTMDFIQAMQTATKSLQQSQGFVQIHSPGNTPVLYAEDDDVYMDAVFRRDSALSIDKMLALMRASPLTSGRLIAQQSNTFAIIGQMPNDYDSYEKVKAPAEFFQKTINQAFSKQEVKTFFSGIAFTRVGILKLMMQDLLMLVPLTTLVVVIFMYVLFRSHLVVVLSLLSSIFAVLATLALMGINDADINQLSLTFPILLMVIVVANIVHFFHRYFAEIEQGKAVDDAVFITTQRIGIASLLSCLTTTIGFYTLMTANMPVLFSFGFYLGTGVMLSFLGTMLIVPPCLFLFQPKAHRHKLSGAYDWLDKLVQRLISKRWRLTVVAAGMALLLISGYLASIAQYDYFLSDMLGKKHPQTVASQLMDKELSGSLPLQIALQGKSGDFKQADNLQLMQALGQWLEQHTSSPHWLSLASLLEHLNTTLSGQKRLPDNNAAIAQLLLLLEGGQTPIVNQWVNADFSQARIQGTIKDIGAAQLMRLRQDFEQYANQLGQARGITVRMTGELPVYYEGMNQMTHELINSVLFALLLVVICIYAVFRDGYLAIASVFPNILPIVMALACYAVAGQVINPLPAIALCIGIGIAVDDTIHLFARFNEERAKGLSVEQAIMHSVHKIKGALIATSLILSAGFLIFLCSAFTWDRELGLLGALLIIIALLADLILTPVVLSFKRDKNG